MAIFRSLRILIVIAICAVGALAIRSTPIVSFLIAGIWAQAEANATPGTPEAHGKVTVKLTKKFSVSVPGATSLAWSPDGSRLAVANGDRIELFDNSGNSMGGFDTNGSKIIFLQLLAFVNGASQLLVPVESAASEDAALDVREVPDGRTIFTLRHAPNAIFRPNGIDNLAVSLDQRRVAVGEGVLHGFLVFGTDDGKKWHEISHEISPDPEALHSGAESLCFFSDGKLLAVGGGEGHFYVADSTTGKVLKEFRAYDAPGIDDNIVIAVSPKGDFILTGLDPVAKDYRATRQSLLWEESDHPMVYIWRASDGKEIAGFRDPGKLIRNALWDPKDRFVAFVDTDSLVVWQPMIAGENYIRVKLGTLSSTLAITHDGKALAVSSGNYATVYDIE